MPPPVPNPSWLLPGSRLIWFGHVWHFDKGTCYATFLLSVLLNVIAMFLFFVTVTAVTFTVIVFVVLLLLFVVYLFIHLF